MKKKVLFAIFATVAAVIGSFGTSLFTQNVYAEPAKTTTTTTGATGSTGSASSTDTTEYVCLHEVSPFHITRWCEDLPANPDFTSGRESIARYILTLVANIYGMITDIAAYVAVILVMYGGFLYVTSSGDPAKNTRGRKVITNSLIGIVIIKSSDIIFKFIKTIAGGAKKESGADAAALAVYIGGRMLYWGGIIAVIMIIWGALQYSMSAGDPAKAVRARRTIVSASIGIGIMMLAAIIVTIVINTLNINN